MDVERALACLNRALVLRQRSVLQFTIGAGSMFGLEYQAVATSCGCSRAPSRRHGAARRRGGRSPCR
jgi:hypothetical protein